jgi:hypothetical protein
VHFMYIHCCYGLVSSRCFIGLILFVGSCVSVYVSVELIKWVIYFSYLLMPCLIMWLDYND